MKSKNLINPRKLDYQHAGRLCNGAFKFATQAALSPKLPADLLSVIQTAQNKLGKIKPENNPATAVREIRDILREAVSEASELDEGSHAKHPIVKNMQKIESNITKKTLKIPEFSDAAFETEQTLKELGQTVGEVETMELRNACSKEVGRVIQDYKVTNVFYKNYNESNPVDAKAKQEIDGDFQKLQEQAEKLSDDPSIKTSDDFNQGMKDYIADKSSNIQHPKIMNNIVDNANVKITSKADANITPTPTATGPS